MAQHLFAPWAELVPGAPAVMTAEDLAHLPDDGWVHELVEGRLVRLPLAGTKHGRWVMSLAFALMQHTQPRGLGIVFTAETGFRLSRRGERDTVLGPDIAFLRAERIPPEEEQEPAFWPVAPDLAVEFASPDQYRTEMADKAVRYLSAGVPLVWIVWPKYRQVDVWRRSEPGPPMTLDATGTLDGGAVLPGFTYPVHRLFG